MFSLVGITKGSENSKILRRQPHEIEVDLYTPDDLVTSYVDITTVMHTQNEFVLSFFQTNYPTINPATKNTPVNKVRGKCIARVIVSPNHMATIVELLQKNLEKFLAKDAKDVNDDSKASR